MCSCYENSESKGRGTVEHRSKGQSQVQVRVYKTENWEETHRRHLSPGPYGMGGTEEGSGGFMQIPSLCLILPQFSVTLTSLSCSPNFLFPSSVPVFKRII